ncbi:MAG TPA: site-2 protease family protein [Solirubrobacteraceae bacterium]|jgi:Zn-dependent protease|nr:site-2 protease family protein [Solirubrobacteraceae bacterium]
MGSIKLMTVRGIRIDVNASWFVMLFLLIFWISGDFKSALQSSSDVAYLTTVVTAVLFFASLIMHELGHAFVAQREGIQVQRISLFLLGGTTYMSRDSQTPGEEFRIAAAGPAGTLLFILIVLAVDLALVGPHRIIHAIELDGTVRITPVLMGLSWLLFMNILIFFFNLVPAYPLDGGRIARAIVWRITDDKLRGTRTAARLGEGFAVLLGGFGLFLLLSTSSYTGIWLMVLAFFTWQSARLALTGTAAASRVQGVRVADVMDHEPVVVHGTSSVLAALDETFARYQSEWLPVIDGDGRFIGIARRERAQQLVLDGEGSATVGSILEPDTGRLTILEDRPLTDVLTLDSLGRLGAVIATDDDDVLTGMVTIDQVRRVLQTVLAEPSPR